MQSLDLNKDLHETKENEFTVLRAAGLQPNQIYVIDQERQSGWASQVIITKKVIIRHDYYAGRMLSLFRPISQPSDAIEIIKAVYPKKELEIDGKVIIGKVPKQHVQQK